MSHYILLLCLLLRNLLSLTTNLTQDVWRKNSSFLPKLNKTEYKEHINFHNFNVFTTDFHTRVVLNAATLRRIQIDPFDGTDLFLYPLKTSEKLQFSDVFRRYRKRSVPWKTFIRFSFIRTLIFCLIFLQIKLHPSKVRFKQQNNIAQNFTKFEKQTKYCYANTVVWKSSFQDTEM